MVAGLTLDAGKRAVSRPRTRSRRRERAAAGSIRTEPAVRRRRRASPGPSAPTRPSALDDDRGTRPAGGRATGIATVERSRRRRPASPTIRVRPTEQPLGRARGRRRRSRPGCPSSGRIGRRARTAARRRGRTRRARRARATRLGRAAPVVAERRVGRHQEPGESRPRGDPVEEVVVLGHPERRVEVLDDDDLDAGRRRAAGAARPGRAGAAAPRPGGPRRGGGRT